MNYSGYRGYQQKITISEHQPILIVSAQTMPDYKNEYNGRHFFYAASS